MATTDSSLLDLEKKLIERQEKIEKEREELDHEKKEIAKKKEEYIEKLQKTSGLTTEEATRELISEIEEKETQTLAKIIKEREEEAKRTADKKAQEILVDSMRHGAVNYIPEYTVSIVRITDEEIKGRIIGKEGRNIRAFEQATGVDVDL
ncbi:MAG: Rnase Y domain-containing protein, partial [Patescibacteria group bacterium]